MIRPDRHTVRLRDLSRDAGARRLSAGRHRQDHVSACAVGLARHAVLGPHDGRRARHAGLASPARRRHRQGRGAVRGCLHSALSRHRLALGPAGWAWDARLTSELILFLLYLGVITLWRTVEDAFARGARGRDPHAGRRDRSADH
jgi:hypothetical protein